MKKFLRDNVIPILMVAVASFAAVSYIAIQRNPDGAIILSELPGPQNQLSDRTKKELKTLLYPNQAVVGAWVSKLKYGRKENPVIWYGAGGKKFDQVILDYISRQEDGRNLSSKEITNVGSAALRNTQASLVGDISCAPIALTALPRLAPLATSVANIVCRAPIPPFNPTANLALVVLIKAENLEDPKVESIRKVMLRLQIDIYNRDFLAREIWIHE